MRTLHRPVIAITVIEFLVLVLVMVIAMGRDVLLWMFF